MTTLEHEDAPSRWLGAFFAIVFVVAATVGGIAAAVAVTNDHPLGPLRDHLVAFLILAGLLLASEIRPVRYLRFAVLGHVVPTTAFSFAILLAYGFPAALAVQVLASVAGDIASRKKAKKVLFNVAQYAIALGAAAAVLAALGTPLVDRNFGAADILPTAIAAAAYFCVNNLLVGTVIALHEGTSPVAVFGEEMRRELPMEALLLGLGPLAAMLAFSSPVLLPLLFLPAIAVYRSSTTAQEMERRTRIDALTGLPNLAGFHDDVTESLASARSGVIAVVDIAGFKHVNDTLGHTMGDTLLIEVARRLVASDAVAIAGRVGGDQFALWAEGDGSEAIAAAISDTFEDHIAVDAVDVAVDVAIGLSRFPEDGATAPDLVRRADMALHQAKRASGGVTWFRADRDEQSPRRLRLLGEMRTAIARGEMVVHYQPQANMATGEIVGLEALVRWQHPELGLLGADEFVALAEQSSVIEPLTAAVLESAVAEIRRQLDHGRFLRVAVNMSVRALDQIALPVMVADVLHRHDVPGALLTVEITESSLLTQFGQAHRVLDALARMAIGISVDDFGTGYSSLRYLREFPISEVKIDRVFTSHVGESDDDDAIVQAIIDLATRLRQGVIAEGVETAEVWDRLLALGCPAVQGYYLSPPMGVDELDVWLSERPVASAR